MTIARGSELAFAVEQLLAEYPTHDVTGDDDPVGAVLTIHDLTDPAQAGEVVDLKLTPGQVHDLLLLVQSEQDTQRRAQSDGDGQCGHCGGTGESGALQPTTHVLAWFPGQLLDKDSAADGWELYDVAQWRAGGTPLARLGGTLLDGAVELLGQVADALGDDHDVVAFQRGTYDIHGFAYPSFDIQARPAEEPPADDGSRP